MSRPPPNNDAGNDAGDFGSALPPSYDDNDPARQCDPRDDDDEDDVASAFSNFLNQRPAVAQAVDNIDSDAVDLSALQASEPGAALASSKENDDGAQSVTTGTTVAKGTTSDSGSSVYVSIPVTSTNSLSSPPPTASEAESGVESEKKKARRSRKSRRHGRGTRTSLEKLVRLVEVFGESMMEGALTWARSGDGEGGGNDVSSSSSLLAGSHSPKSTSSFRALVLLPLLIKIGTMSGLAKDGRRKSSSCAAKSKSRRSAKKKRGENSLASTLRLCAALIFLIVLTSYATSAVSGSGGAGDPGRMAMKSSEPDTTAEGSGIRLSALGASAGVVDLSPPTNTKLPRDMKKLANVDDLPLELTDTAVFWHVPRSGGTTMKHIVATCLGRVITSEVGGQKGHDMGQLLQVIQKPYGSFVDVDTTTPLGLKRASELGLAPSRMADVVFTPYVKEATVLFDKDHRGRFFTMLRDPVSRIQSLYYFRHMDGALGDMTLETFVREQGENWMVRTLTGTMSGQLDVTKLNEAKEILRTKFLIGIFAEKTETLRRIESYFGWKFPSAVAQNCKNQLMYFEWHSRNEHLELAEDDELALLIQRQNRYDMELYEYALQLFREQEKFFWGGDVTEIGGDTDLAQEEVLLAVINARSMSKR